VRNVDKKIVPIIVVIVAALLFPTPHYRIRQEPYVEYETVTKSDLVGLLDCSGTLKDGWLWHWDETNLPADLRILVEISSTEEVQVYMKSVAGEVTRRSGKEHGYTVYASGPSLYVEVKNPSFLGLGLGTSAVISGEISIYHDYTEQVPITKYHTITYTEWLPWWIP